MAEPKSNNQDRWNNLVKSGVPCSRPSAEVTKEEARSSVDPHGLLGDLQGKRVLCLASGGGQQSVYFAILGADVTVVDFSEDQLEKDKAEAQKRSLPIEAVHADMRDLSKLKDHSYDVIYHPYSINYVLEIDKVFDEVRRVIKPQGLYYLMFHNPVVQGSWKDGCWGSQWEISELWEGIGYPLRLPYQEGFPVNTVDPFWNFYDEKGNQVRVPSPQEYKHTFSTIFNGLISRNFRIIRFDEYSNDGEEKTPGSWDHYVSVAAPWMSLWAKFE